jgi:hypothetical protein
MKRRDEFMMISVKKKTRKVVNLGVPQLKGVKMLHLQFFFTVNYSTLFNKLPVPSVSWRVSISRLICSLQFPFCRQRRYHYTTASKQGDQIGRIFGNWAIVYFWQFFN